MTQVQIAKIGSLEVDESKLSEAVRAYIFSYGLKQMLNDVHASEKDADKKMALSRKKLDSLYRGEVAQQRSSGDSVTKVMRELAEIDVKAKLATTSIKWSKLDRKVQQQVIDKQVAANEASYRAAAEARLAIKPKSAETPEDIMALLQG